MLFDPSIPLKKGSFQILSGVEARLWVDEHEKNELLNQLIQITKKTLWFVDPNLVILTLCVSTCRLALCRVPKAKAGGAAEIIRRVDLKSKKTFSEYSTFFKRILGDLFLLHAN
jgi:hypothetical protein